MTEKCWSVNGEDFFDDWGRLIEELQDYECDEIPVGTEYFEGDKVDVKISDYVNVYVIDSMLEQFECLWLFLEKPYYEKWSEQ